MRAIGHLALLLHLAGALLCVSACRVDGYFVFPDSTESGDACDAKTNRCIRCLSNNECDSGICLMETGEIGACVDKSTIVYAVPGGPTMGECLQTAPCSIKTALTIAATHPDRSVVLMSPGTYATDLVIIGGNPLMIIGDGATVTGGSAIGLWAGDGANVTVLGLTVATGENLSPIGCRTSDLPTKLRLLSVSVSGTPAQGFYAANGFDGCEVTMDQVVMHQVANPVRRSTIVIDRSRILNVDGLVGTALVLQSDSGGTSVLTMTNSVVSGGLTFEGNQTVSVSFSTIYGCEGPALPPLGCNRGVEGESSNGSGLSFRNNIIAGQSVTDSVNCTSCGSLQASFVNNILYPQGTAISGNFVVPPQLVSPANHDYRLSVGSPAIDAADAVTTDHDLVGTMRPAGPRADLGAFELAP